MKGFFKTLKAEPVEKADHVTQAEARSDVFAFPQAWYEPPRLRPAIG